MTTIIAHLTTEYGTNPLGIDVTAPRFGWQLQTDRAGACQTAYRVLAASDPALLSAGRADLWDSGRIESDQSVHVAYSGESLASRQRVHWNVTVWDENGDASTSDPAWFELGLLKRRDWKAKWIGTQWSSGPRSTLPAPYLRKAFALPGSVKSARLYVTALGLYECSINGQRVGDDVFTPGWTDYRKRIQYQVYDVADLLRGGDNVLGALLGDGWAVGHVGWMQRQLYADRPMLFAQLEVTLEDGKIITVTSDNTWKYQFGPVTHNDFLAGEAYDARLELPGWDAPGFDDRRWLRAETFAGTGAALVATNGPTVRRIEELKPVSDPVDNSGFTSKRYVFDLGQNMVGRVRFTGSAPRGTTITLRFAEVLDADGQLYTTNLRNARATDYYTFGGDAETITWEPKFTFHGFRYVELSGYLGDVSRDTITGVVLHSEMEPTGSFESSDPLLNQLQHNIVWGQKGNFVDIPTDCPQRDERLGWTGDIQVFARTAAFNMNVAGFMTKWAQDVTDAQSAAGAVPPVVPSAMHELEDGGPAWADAAVISPWTIYLCYGDKRILETSYATMTRFMDFLVSTSPGLIRCAPEYQGWPGFSDWLSINATTPRDLIGTAYLGYDAQLMAQIAAALGKQADERRYRKLFADVKAAYSNRYLKGSPLPQAAEPPSELRKQMDDADAISRGNLKAVDYGPIDSDVYNADLFTPTQTALVLGLHFNLLPDELRPRAVAELVADLERRGMHLSTGFVGSSYLPHVLSSGGRADIAFALLNQQTWPSWVYAVTQGATTIWERWDGWTPESGFQDPGMNSFNHYAYGAIGAWLYNTVAGIDIDPAQPGYKHSILRPLPGGGLTSVKGGIKTLYGELASAWKRNKGAFEWEVTVPPNTTATAYLPVDESAKVKLNGRSVKGTVHELSAGTHRFVAK